MKQRLVVRRVGGKTVVKWPLLVGAVAVGLTIHLLIHNLFAGDAYYAVAVPLALSLVIGSALRTRRLARADRAAARPNDAD